MGRIITGIVGLGVITLIWLTRINRISKNDVDIDNGNTYPEHIDVNSINKDTLNLKNGYKYNNDDNEYSADEDHFFNQN